MRVNIGDFITIDYLDFNDQISRGIFYVVYHECYDIPSSQSFVAVKVSSKSSGYQVPVDKTYAHFLNKNSFINCSSLHRFQEKQVKKILGRSNDYYRNRVLKQLTSYFNTVENQMKNSITGKIFS